MHWVPVPDAARQQLAPLLPPTAAYPSTASWLKLFLPQLLAGCGLGLNPPRQVLYMDCDMLALTSMQPLLQQGLQGE